MTRAHDITLVGTTFDSNTDDPKWWDYELEQQKYAEQIEKKNSNILKPVFKKMHEMGIVRLEIPFSGGGDCGGFDGNIEFYKENGDEEKKPNFDKMKPDGWRTHYIPLIHKVPTKTKNKSECHIFEYQYTDYKDFKIDTDWLIQRFYEFGFLNEWGTFAGEYHVSGRVIIYTKSGNYSMPYQQSVEEYEDLENCGNMFDMGETNETKNNN